MKDRMRPGFRPLEGGLFSDVTKADVGSAYERMAADGIDLMSWADPFYPDPSIPPHVLAKAREALEGGFPAHYTMPVGSGELRRAVARRLERFNGLKADPERNILITPGSDSGLFYAMLPFLGPGDEVLVPDPSYPSNFLNPSLLGAAAVRVPLREEDGYHLHIEEFERRLTPRTRMVLLCNPNNPTGTVYARRELEELARFIVEHDLICVADQAFESTVFDGREFVSVASLPGMWERTLTVFSISKGMGLSGFRVGYLVADDPVMDVLYGGAVNVLGATGTLSQRAALAAFQDDAFIEDYRRKHDRRRRYAYELFRRVPGVTLNLPESGFFTWLNVSSLGDSGEVAKVLLEEARVAVNDGAAYGEQGRGHLRIVHGCYWEDARAFGCLERIAGALEELAR